MYKKAILKFSYLTKITNSTIKIYLELDELEDMSVSVGCRLGLADTLCSWQDFQNIFKVIKSGL